MGIENYRLKSPHVEHSPCNVTVTVSVTVPFWINSKVLFSKLGWFSKKK